MRHSRRCPRCRSRDLRWYSGVEESPEGPWVVVAYLLCGSCEETVANMTQAQVDAVLNAGRAL